MIEAWAGIKKADRKRADNDEVENSLNFFNFEDAEEWVCRSILLLNELRKREQVLSLASKQVLVLVIKFWLLDKLFEFYPVILCEVVQVHQHVDFKGVVHEQPVVRSAEHKKYDSYRDK